MRFLSFLLLFAALRTSAQFNTSMKIEHSESVGDNFEIYISTPTAHDPAAPYQAVYYCDANLRSGKVIRDMLASGTYDKKLSNYIFIGIGHIGDYHSLRRRDFILPFINGKDTAARNATYGHVEEFYSFIKSELIPQIDAHYRTDPTANSLIGHSLGGLFTFYCLFRNENIFSRFFALSPALWIDDFSIYRFNRIFDGFENNTFLYLASGSKETTNRILRGTDDAKQFLDKARYSHFQYRYDIHAKKTHESEVPVSLEKIFVEML